MIKVYLPESTEEIIVEQVYSTDMRAEDELRQTVAALLKKAGKTADMVKAEDYRYRFLSNKASWWWLVVDFEGTAVDLLNGTLTEPCEFTRNDEQYVCLLNSSSIGWNPDRYLATCYLKKDFIKTINHTNIIDRKMLTDVLGPNLLERILADL